MDEYMRCLLFVNSSENECRGANGLKLRQDCGYCPNYKAWTRHKKDKKEKEETEKNGQQSENIF